MMRGHARSASSSHPAFVVRRMLFSFGIVPCEGLVGRRCAPVWSR
jgi:hypothetical protein